MLRKLVRGTRPANFSFDVRRTVGPQEGGSLAVALGLKDTYIELHQTDQCIDPNKSGLDIFWLSLTHKFLSAYNMPQFIKSLSSRMGV